MKFQNKKSVTAWCQTNNKIWLDVEKLCIRYEKALRAGGDPKCIELAIALYKLSTEFQKGLREAREKITDKYNKDL